MTLSSRDPHLGQRIVWKSQLPYHSLWCQCFFDCLYELARLSRKRRCKDAYAFRKLLRNRVNLVIGFRAQCFGVRGVFASLFRERGDHPSLTRRTADDRRFEMQNRTTRSASYGPWLVGLGASLWGTESAWRIPLNELFDAKVIVFWEHVLILIMFLPILIARFDEILNIHPVISTMAAFLVFGDRLAPRFFLYASIAILAGIFVSVAHPALIGVSFERAGLSQGTGFALICALFWGLSTVAGRGVMIGMSLRLAASLRIVVGLTCMTLILLAYGKLHGAALWPVAAQGHAAKAIVLLLLLASVSGGIPLLIYFEGLRLTRASTAGYFEMMQTLAAVCITWGFFHASLHLHQVVAALILIAAVAMVHRVQQHIEPS